MKEHYIRKTFLIIIMIVALCIVISPTNRRVEAALQTQYTGDDIMNEAIRQANGATYWGVGTCTGFFARVLRSLGIGSSITDWRLGSYAGPDKVQGVDVMYLNALSSDEVKFVWEGRKDQVIDNLGLFRNGDFYFLTNDDNPTRGSEHVGFMYIHDDKIEDFGAINASHNPQVGARPWVSGIDWGAVTPLSALASQLAGDYDITPYGNDTSQKWYIHVYRLAEDKPKKMKIKIQKSIILASGEKADIGISGVEFTVYRNEACTEQECVIGPTDSNGQAESPEMKSGTYYLKETKFPTGVDPNAIIPGDTVSYRDKVYVVSVNPDEQVEELQVELLSVGNAPIRNSIEIRKDLGETSNTNQVPLSGCEFTAYLKSSIGTGNEYSKKCSAPTDENGYCIIEDLPYGEYVVKETKVNPLSMPCADFEVFVQKDKSVKANPYEPSDGNFLDTTLQETLEEQKNYDASTYEWLDDNGHIVNVPKVMKIKIRKVDYDRTELDPKDYTQGDAVLENAKYQIYRYNEATDTYEKVKRTSGEDYVITVDHKDDGYWCAESDELLVGKYMVKELTEHSETIEGVKYDFSYATGYYVDPEPHYFEQNSQEQTSRVKSFVEVSKEEVIRGRVSVFKMYSKDNSSSDPVPQGSEQIPAAGARMRLVLNSSIPKGAVKDPLKPNDYYMLGTKYYEVLLDDFGSGEFVEEESREKYYPRTIPYGEYTIIEVEEAPAVEGDVFFIQPKRVSIHKPNDISIPFTFTDPTYDTFLKIQKRDRDNNENAMLAGAKFKIWDVKNGEFVTQLSSNDHDFISEYETNEEGFLIMPRRLLAGEYVIYETQAPNGYYLDEEYRLPTDDKGNVIESKLGKAEFGGKYIDINKENVGVDDNIVYYPENREYRYTVYLSDPPLKAKLKIYKKGEMLTGYTSETTEYGEKYTPKYDEKGLPGVIYNIVTAEDIKSPDGRIIYHTKGEVVDKIETNLEGIAVSRELYPGKYNIVEVEAPLGYVKDTEIKEVNLESSQNQYVRVKTTNKEFSNEKQSTKIHIEKTLEDPVYDVRDEYIKVVMGIYSNEDIKEYTGNNVAIPKNKLLDVVEGEVRIGESIELVSDVNLPKGQYYARELYVDYPYEVDTNDHGFEIKPKNIIDETLDVSGITIHNTIPTPASLGFVKLSTAVLYDEKVGHIDNGLINENQIDEFMQPILNWVNENPLSKVKAALNGEIEIEDIELEKCKLLSNYTLEGAEYSIYYDKDKKEPFTKNGVPVYIKTDGNGFSEIEDMPLGEYYVFEEKAPILHYEDKQFSYKKQKEPIKVILDNNAKDKNVARALYDRFPIIGPEFEKKDILTAEAIENCTFRITDNEGKTIVEATTDDEGIFRLKLEWFEEGETYFYQEIKAPGIYDLNTEPHEFKIEFDENGKLIPTKVENRRKTRDLMVRKTDSKTGEVLQGCVFTIAMVNADGTQKYHAETGEPIYLVENAVTDENGEYYIEDVPMGTYMFTEITPPEGYELDEDLTGHIFTIDENSPELTIFEITNTGDIAVIAIACVGIVSILGIALVIVKNKKQRA